MSILKSAIFFLIIILIPFNTSDHSHHYIKADTQNNIKSHTIFSGEFYRLEYSLLNQQLKYSVDDSIQSLKSNFEKDYLLSLIKTRKTKYLEAFNQLNGYLPSFPKHYQYYEQLIFNAKASGNFSKVEDAISKIKIGKNEYSDYLAALVNYNLNNYSAVIRVLSDKEEFNGLFLLSFAYRGLADYQNSIKVLQKCKQKIDPSDFNMPKILVAEGSLYLLSGDYKNADKIYQKAIQLADNLNNQKEKAKALINLAILDDQNGDILAARNKLEAAFNLSGIIENQDLEATVLSELGVSYTYTNEIVSARNNYEKSLVIYKILNNKERLSNLSANIAAIYAQQTNYSLALMFYNNGLNYAGENIFSKILNLRGLGDVYANLSNYSKALNYYTQAKELAKSIRNVRHETDIDISIGTLFYNISKPLKALEIFLNAKDKMRENNDAYAFEDVNFKIGITYARIDSIVKSNEYLHEALYNARSVGDIYYDILISNELAYNYYLLKDYQNAEKLLLSLLPKSKQSGFSQLESVQNLYLGKIKLDQKKISKALIYLNNSKNIAVEVKDYNTFLAAEFLIGKCFESVGNLADAEYHYNSAIKTINKISETMVSNSEIQISHFAGLNEPFNALAELYLKQNKKEEALQIIEESRSRNTFQNLNNLLISSGINDDSVLIKYYDLKWQINSGIYNGEKLASLESEFKTLSEKYFIKDKKVGNVFSINKVRSSLTENEFLITYFLSDSTLSAFITSKNNFYVYNFDISRRDVINMISHISAIYSHINEENNFYFNQDLFSFNTKASNVFYNSVLSTVISHIPKNAKLIFSMPTEMALIPIEFLVTDFKKGDSPFLYDNKNYLIENYAISYTPSISVFLLQNKITEFKDRKLLFIGDPLIDNKDFATSYRGGLLEENPFKSRSIVLFPLKYSKQEIEELSRMFSNKSVFLSNDATEKNFKDNAANSSIIHLSTHSFLYKDQPLIIFSQSTEKDSAEDGYLEAGEINRLKLNSDMVVLSSCRSGVGSIDKAEGILGMQKSFFEAGAKSVVVSMWDVNDKYTSLFMQSFYKYLIEGYDKSEALRKAKIFFKQNYSSNPYYWAAFVLSGNISPINISKANNFPSVLLVLLILSISLLVLFLFYYNRIKQN